jgi:hypothetical protein
MMNLRLPNTSTVRTPWLSYGRVLRTIVQEHDNDVDDKEAMGER